MTIRKKLILLYSGMLAVVIIVFGLVIFTVIRSTWIQTVDSALAETAAQVKNNGHSYPIYEFGNLVDIGVSLPKLDVFRASGVLVQAWLMTPNNKLGLAGSSDSLVNFHQPLDPNALGSSETVFANIQIEDTELRVMTSPIRVLGQDRVFGYIQAALSLETINRATNKLWLFMLVVGGVAVMLSIMLGTWLSDQSLKPIEAITEAADNISTAKDLATRLPWDGPPDELGRLTSVFNRMMDRLEHLFGVQQRFVADVSHELRTPLTAIRGNLDIIKHYGLDQPSLEAIESETLRMSRMVSDLLLLARADGGSITLDMSDVDLDTVLSDIFREAKILAQNRELQIRLAHLEPIRIQGNSDRLKQLLLNLVSNAIKFTPDGGQVSLSLRRENTQAALQVSDTGIGIKADDLKRIFDRFYQADSSRTREQSSDGAGLGLSIAQWIAQAHGGVIEAESTVGKGTTFTVRLPMTSTQVEVDQPQEAELSYGDLALQKLGLNRKRSAPPEAITEG